MDTWTARWNRGRIWHRGPHLAHSAHEKPGSQVGVAQGRLPPTACNTRIQSGPPRTKMFNKRAGACAAPDVGAPAVRTPLYIPT